MQPPWTQKQLKINKNAFEKTWHLEKYIDRAANYRCTKKKVQIFSESFNELDLQYPRFNHRLKIYL